MFGKKKYVFNHAYASASDALGIPKEKYTKIVEKLTGMLKLKGKDVSTSKKVEEILNEVASTKKDAEIALRSFALISLRSLEEELKRKLERRRGEGLFGRISKEPSFSDFLKDSGLPGLDSILGAGLPRGLFSSMIVKEKTSDMEGFSRLISTLIESVKESENLKPEEDEDGECGCLRCHLARMNRDKEGQTEEKVEVLPTTNFCAAAQIGLVFKHEAKITPNAITVADNADFEKGLTELIAGLKVSEMRPSKFVEVVLTEAANKEWFNSYVSSVLKDALLDKFGR